MTRTKLIKAIKDLKLPYFDKEQIKPIRNGISIHFCLPRNSLFILVEFCKTHDLCIAFSDRKKQIEIGTFGVYPKKYEVLFWK